MDQINRKRTTGSFLRHVAEMDANPKLDATPGRQARVALDEAVLHLDRAAQRVHHSTELDEAANITVEQAKKQAKR
jgi:hypothetical protein